MRPKDVRMIAWCCFALLPFALFAADGAPAAGVKDLVAALPAAKAADGQAIAAKIVALGPEAIETICGMLADPETGGDAKARFALHGLALYVTRPNAEAERAMFAGKVLEALAAEGRPEVKAFLVEQLQLAGKDEAVDALGKLLCDDRLGDPAALALTRIGTPKAAAALAGALGAAKDRRLVAIVQALGVLRAQGAAKDLLALAKRGDPTLHRTALRAIANIGDASGAEVLAKAAGPDGDADRAFATDQLILFARRRAEAGAKDECAKICRDVIAAQDDAGEAHVVCAALRTMAYGVGADAKNDIIRKTQSENTIIRETAKSLAVRCGMMPDEEGFTCLFNGEDLTGWTGSVKGYLVEDGKIICLKRGGGNLYIDKEYGDFVFRFEFKLTSGANNGLGIRAEKGKDAAYHGMELQILDDTADMYKNLQPYQYHGSIYGVVPVKRGHQRPLGQWNVQEVIAKGPHIQVILNGEKVIDADLDAYIEMKDGVPQSKTDHRAHPGIKNPKGYIGFLGHGAHVEFRNIRIKEL
ncbi:MAG: DUF1080 domain-containing protein [Planctomycetes bacterium]|nr:DUF1080 domain-containing protein [Planctomycetota bacterium]